MVASPAGPSLRARLAEGGRPLAALLALALLLKLLVVAAALTGNPLARHPTSDSRYYLDRAQGLAGRVPDPLAQQPYHLPPLYPWVAALVPGALDGRFGGVYAAQALAGTAALAGVWLLARARLSRPAALLAVALVAAYAPLTLLECRLLGDSLAASLCVALLVTADGYAARPLPWRGALLGVLAGALTLLRPQAVLLLVAVAIWAASRRRAGGGALLLAAALTIAPATWHNLSTGGGWTLVSDNGGVNLWLAASGPPSGTFLVHDPAFGDIARQADAAASAAEASAGRPLRRSEVSSVLGRAALAAMAADPAGLLQRIGLRARALLENFETGVVDFPEVERQLVAPAAVLVLPFGVLLAAAAAGAVLSCRRRPSGGPPLFPALALAGMVVLTTLFFFHYSRFRMPLVPLLALLAAALLDSLLTRRPQPLRALLALAAAGVAAAISWAPGPHHGKALALGWTAVAEARVASASPGDLSAIAAALGDARRALEHDGGLVRAHQAAANACLSLGRFADCARHLARITDGLPDHPPARMTRAWLAATPHPDNPAFDPSAARALLEGLRLDAAADPSLAAHLPALERQIEAAERAAGG